jgi:hypothetical protein
MEKHRVQNLSRTYAALDRNADEYLQSYFPPGRCRGNCDSANAFKLHLMDQLSKLSIWAPGLCGPHSLAAIREKIKTAVFSDIGTLTPCGSRRMIDSMRTTRDIARQIATDMAKHLDAMVTKITFDPARRRVWSWGSGH